MPQVVVPLLKVRDVPPHVVFLHLAYALLRRQRLPQGEVIDALKKRERGAERVMDGRWGASDEGVYARFACHVPEAIRGCAEAGNLGE